MCRWCASYCTPWRCVPSFAHSWCTAPRCEATQRPCDATWCKGWPVVAHPASASAGVSPFGTVLSCPARHHRSLHGNRRQECRTQHHHHRRAHARYHRAFTHRHHRADPASAGGGRDTVPDHDLALRATGCREFTPPGAVRSSHGARPLQSGNGRVLQGT